MNSNIQIVEKPDWVSWDDIHDVLTQAHKSNREKGIIMRKPSLPGELIEREFGKDDVMLVALDGTIVIGTAALLVKECSTWYFKGQYGYLCFASVLPQYAGRGVYKNLCEERVRIAKEKGLKGLLFDTHHKNKHVININRKNGFKRVAVRNHQDHWNVVMFKWFDGCPHANSTCFIHFFFSVFRSFLYRLKRTIFK